MSDEIKQYRQELYKTLSYSNEQFDRNVLFIASGALGVSIAFIEKIVPDLNCAVAKNTLICAWGVFAGVVFVSLVSHFISSWSLRWSIENLESKGWIKGLKYWNYAIRTLNVIMIFGLLIGSVLLIHFINLNINKP